MASKTWADGVVIDTPWLQDVNDLTYGLPDATTPLKGAGLVPFDPTLNYTARTLGAVLKDGYINAMWFIPTEVERAAIQAYTSTTDHTSYINAALAYGKRVYVPEGLWNINPNVSIVLTTGCSIIGDGLTRTIFRATAVGGSIAELVAYTHGSVIRRAFTPGVANDYVNACYLADFTVLLNHPAYNVANYKQIAIDLRNVTRSVVERVFTSNATDAQTGHPYIQTRSAADQTQGYGFVLGTRAAPPDYCGGEGNTIRDCMPWGLYKNITIDDVVLSPASSAHTTLIDNCDIQGGHELLTQSSQYGAGMKIVGTTVQGTRRQTGNVDPTIAVSFSGYSSSVEIKYAEMGTACDILFNFASSSRNCVGRLLYYSSTAPSVAAISDTGTKNHLVYPAPIVDTVPVDDVTSGFGDLIELFDKAYRTGHAKCTVSGGVVTQLSNVGEVAITRISNGRYRARLTRAMPNLNWTATVVIENAGAAFGGVTAIVGSQSTTDFQFFTYTQAAGVTTNTDPVTIYLTYHQI